MTSGHRNSHYFSPCLVTWPVCPIVVRLQYPCELFYNTGWFRYHFRSPRKSQFVAKQRLDHFYGTWLRARGSSQTDWRQLTVQSFVKYWKYSPITNSPAPDQCCWISFRRLDRVAPAYSARDSFAKVLKVFTNSGHCCWTLFRTRVTQSWDVQNTMRITQRRAQYSQNTIVYVNRSM